MESTTRTGRALQRAQPPALIAYYCGVFSILLFPAPFALILGIIGLNKIKREPALPGKAHAIVGIVLGSIFGLLWLGLILLAVVPQGMVTSIH